MKQGDVWLDNVLFKETFQTKHRPVIIVGNELALNIDVIIAPVTSQGSRNQFDVALNYWEKTGLLTPSVVRTSKSVSIHCSELKRYLGTLHDIDIKRVSNMCRSLF